MAEQENNTPAQNLPSTEDTRTRKTVRLRPTASTASPMQLADPLSGRNTNTGNLEILDDTQTRRTVKLKPLVPHGMANFAKTAPAPASVAPAPVTPPVAGEDTTTRKTVMLRPAASKPAAPAPAPAPAPVPTPVTPPVSGEDTTTRKTVMLKPAAAQKSDDPATASAPVPAGNTDDEDIISRTIRIKRPDHKPIIGPTPAAPVPATPARKNISKTAQTAVPAEESQPAENVPAEENKPKEDATVALPKPAEKISQNAPKPAAEAISTDESKTKEDATVVLPKPTEDAAAALPKPAEKNPKTTPPVKSPVPAAASQTDFPFQQPPAVPKASKLYFVLALLTLIFIVVTAVLTTAHYLNFNHHLNYTNLVPMMPQIK